MTWPRVRPAAALALLILLAIGFLQLRTGVYGKDLASHPDEPAHFVTGVMVYDYLRTAAGSNPIAFGEEYYVRFPKVAFGHWPPLFYLLQAAWYAVAGVSTTSALLLAGLFTALALIVAVSRLTALHGVAMGLLGAAILLLSPIVRQSATMFLSDMPAALLTLLALLALSDARRHPTPRGWLRFAVWTAAAILAKTSAATLAALVVLEARRFFTGRRVWLGLALLALAVGAVAVMVVYRGAAIFNSDWIARLPLLARGLRVVPWPAIPVVLAAWWPKQALSPERASVRLTITAFLAIALPAQLLARDVIEPRYFLPLLFPALFLFAEGAQTLVQRLPSAGRPAALAALASLWILTFPPAGAEIRSGYDQAARAIPLRAPVLISADPSGEGAFIAARLIHDRARGGIVLRASKLLMRSDWMGRDYRPLLDSADQVARALDQTAVRYVVLDRGGYLAPLTRPHHRLLLDAVADHTRFRLVATFPLVINGVRWSHAIQVFEYLAARGHGLVRVDLENSLGRTLQLAVTNDSRGTSVQPAAAGPPEPDTPFQFAPHRDSFDWTGGPGLVYFTGPAPFVASLPPWITLESATPFLAYRVAANPAAHPRSATLSIGGQPLPVTQARNPYRPLPFEEDFSDWPDRWILESHGAPASLAAGAGPDHTAALLLEKTRADAQPYLTQLYLPYLEMEPGHAYQLSVSLKADRPASLQVTVARKQAPYGLCGMAEPVQATQAWTRHTFRFVFSGDGCTAATARLSLLVGGIDSRLSIAGLSLRPQ